MKRSQWTSEVAAILWQAVATACVAVVLPAAAARAVIVDWEVDETLSEVELDIPDQEVTIGTTTATIRLRNQSGGNSGPWNVGNVAAVDGVLATDYVDSVSIRFLSGLHNAFALESGSYRPNQASFDPLLINAENPDGQFTDESSAPGMFGARVRATVSIFTLDAAYLNFTEAFYDIASDVLPITAGSFPGNALNLGFDQATIAFDGLDTLIGQPIPDAEGSQLLDLFGLNFDAGATITAPDPLEPDLRMMTIPIDLSLVADIGGVPLDVNATGTIVAFTLLPEPGATLMLGSGAMLLACLDRRRGRCARIRRRRPAA